MWKIQSSEKKSRATDRQLSLVCVCFIIIFYLLNNKWKGEKGKEKLGRLTSRYNQNESLTSWERENFGEQMRHYTDRLFFMIQMPRRAFRWSGLKGSHYKFQNYRSEFCISIKVSLNSIYSGRWPFFAIKNLDRTTKKIIKNDPNLIFKKSFGFVRGL